MLSLLAPGALLGLAVLAVPPLLHLRRRSEQNLVRFAALRWLGQGARPRRQVRLEDRLLLASRLCLLASLVLLLAEPVWRARIAATGAWAVVTPGLDPAAARAAADSAAAQWRWLAPGFPPLDRAAPADTGTNFFSLLRQLDAGLPAGTVLHVMVPETLSGLDAERPQLRQEVNWHVLPTGGTATAPRAPPGNALRLALRYDAGHAAGLPLVHALASAWRAGGIDASLDEAQSAAAPGDTVDALFWLGGEVPPTLRHWARDGGTLVAGTAGAAADEVAPAVFEVGQGRILLFSGALEPALNPALLAPELPTQLLALLRHNTAPPDRAQAATVAPLLAADSASGDEDTTSFERPIALFAALLFFFERSLALRAASARK
jgi:hypothetical protein